MGSFIDSEATLSLDQCLKHALAMPVAASGQSEALPDDLQLLHAGSEVDDS